MILECREVGVTNHVAKAKCIKIIRKFQTKVSKYCSAHFNMNVFRSQKHTDIRIVFSILLIYQDIIIEYVHLRGKN